MRCVIQRVSSASVSIQEEVKGVIEHGLLLLVGFENEDNETDIDWLINKLINLRIFSDDEGKMNLNIKDVNGDFLVISQFTLFARTKKGNRPSYIHSAKPDVAIPLYQQFIEKLTAVHEGRVATGEFGADMQVALVNDGPVTITIDTKNKE